LSYGLPQVNRQKNSLLHQCSKDPEIDINLVKCIAEQIQIL